MKSIVKIFSALFVLTLTFGVSFAGVASREDLKTARVGVQSGSTSESLVLKFLGNGGGSIKPFNDIHDIIDALKNGDIDAAVMDESPARYFVIGDPALKILPETMASEYYAIAFRKGNPLRNEVDKVMDELIAEKALAKIMVKYINGDYDASAIDFNRGAKGGKLWVGCAADFPPYEERTENGLAGIDVELSAAIAKKLGKELVMVDYKFDALPDALRERKIDMICSAMSITDQRLRTMDFSKPYDANQEVIVVLAEDR